MKNPSQMNVDDLLLLARDKSVEARTKLTAAVSDLFFGDSNVLSERERTLMTSILHQLIHDVEMSVRKTLAERMAAQPNAPLELIRELANDEIDVARPILIRSKVLQDSELVEIIQHRTMEHQLAISMREDVSEKVADALVETGSTDVVGSLLENPSARISKSTMEYLVEQSQRVDVYQNPLLRRPDLDPKLAKKMYWWVSAALRKHIVEHFDIDPATLDDTIETAVGEVVSHLDEESTSTKPFMLARELIEAGSVTPQFLIRTLRQGEIALFEALLVEMTGLRMQLIRRILFESGGEGLGMICRMLGVEKPDYASIFLLSRKVRPGDKVVDPRELSRALDFYAKISREAAEGVVKRMRRDPDYLDSLRRLSSLKDIGS